MILILLSISEPIKVLNIVDYIAYDYEAALNNQEEYKEMLEFSENLLKLSDSSIMDYSKTLYELIRKKASVNEIKDITAKIRNIILSNPNFDIYPRGSISLKRGKEIYLNNCSVCHGEKGYGDGPISNTLEPRPTNFHQRNDLSALRVYVVLNTGLVNMPPFNNLSESDKWNTAFYVLSLIHENKKVKKVKDTLSLALLSKLSDNDLLNMGYNQNEISYIRTYVEEFSKKDYFSSLINNLELIKSLYNNKEYEKAYSLSVSIYFDDFEPIEKQLISKDFNFAMNLEQKFTQLRALVKEKNKTKEVENLISSIKMDLLKAKDLVDKKIFSGYWAFFNSFTIIFREGLEVAILLGIILSIVSLSQNRTAIKLVHFGWISAIILGIITFLISQFVINITTLSREVIEAIVGLLAAIVLFQVSYWLISKAESKVWINYIKEKLKTSLSKGKLTFVFFLSFLATYREAFETVLFYQAMLINTEKSSINTIILGFIIGLIVVVLIAIGIIKLQLKLPLKYLFPITGSALYLLSFIFLGQSIRSFQEAIIIPTTHLEFIPLIDFLGIYPTLETTIAQVILIVLALLLVIVIKRKVKKEEITLQKT
ncbi:MAG: cytochrome c/FTR1 family iron permease [candidate division WOR-3 bacterium]|nr:cytochrome c/FTR1 family iron permease [candidate division WOR-3 bacterium]MDW8150215.1 cytochrome c/FTR1 family iron permease [candidate division WOR-3 bacterium]